MTDIPVISLSIRGMKYEILHALSRHQLDLSAEVTRAVEAWCQSENVERVVAEHVRVVLDGAVREEIERFYRRGEGAQIIREAVRKRLGQEEPF